MIYVYADSTNRDTAVYPSGNSFTLHLTTPIQQIVAVDLVSAKVPNAFYNLTAGTNVLQFNSTYISLAPGFYSACGLAESIVAATGKAFTVDFSANEGKFIISSSSAFTLTPETVELEKLLGMTSGVHTAVLGSTIPEYTYDAYYGGRYLVKSDQVIDLRITFDTPVSKISRLTIRWLDKDGQLLNFQGFDNTAFVLRFEVLEPKEPEPVKEPELTELQVQRMIEAMLPPPQEPQKKGVPRIFLYLLAIVLLGIGVKLVFFKNNVPVQ
ncbi:hypothetical protein EBT25_08170 [bacterium]|nr:hypothetical protein [bacterium]